MKRNYDHLRTLMDERDRLDAEHMKLNHAIKECEERRIKLIKDNHVLETKRNFNRQLLEGWEEGKDVIQLRLSIQRVEE